MTTDVSCRAAWMCRLGPEEVTLKHTGASCGGPTVAQQVKAEL